MSDVNKLFTFQLIDGRLVTYAGLSESAAYRRAEAYHPYAIVTMGKPTALCVCSPKCAKATREGGWLVCDRPECAGRIG